jgi:hypothetical protein
MGQLAHIHQTLKAVQTLATVGAVASVASLGVSVAGFAVVLSKLQRMDGKLDKVLSETAKIRSLAERLHVKIDALPVATLRSELEAVHMAWRYEPTRRRESLQASVRTLTNLRHYYAELLANEEFCLQGTEGLLTLLDTHERLVAAAQGELFAEFLIDDDNSVLEERWRLQQESLNSVAWRSPEALYELAEQGDRDNGVFLVTVPADRQSKVLALTEIRRESIERLASLPALATFLDDRGVRNEAYVRLLQAKALTEGGPLIAVDASRNGEAQTRQTLEKRHQ